MSVPKSVVKFSRKGIEYISSVEYTEYTIKELTRAALRDVGKFVCRKCNTKAMHLPNLGKTKRVRGRTSAFQFWVRKKDADLQVGIKHDTWYGVDQEMGTRNQPPRQFLRGSVNDNIDTIIEIESKYLSALNQDDPEQLISEEEYQGGDTE